VEGDSKAQNDEAGNFSAILTEIFIDGHLTIASLDRINFPRSNN
jgi:hypothetical protein